jgi:hypothetical protein
MQPPLRLLSDCGDPQRPAVLELFHQGGCADRPHLPARRFVSFSGQAPLHRLKLQKRWPLPDQG